MVHNLENQEILIIWTLLVDTKVSTGSTVVSVKHFVLYSACMDHEIFIPWNFAVHKRHVTMELWYSYQSMYPNSLLL